MYVPLRIHGHHSLLTGVDAPRELLERVRGLGLGAMALADVDGLPGLVEFLGAARRAGVRPIVAAELSDPSGEPGRLVALVRNEVGYRNLCKLVSARHLGRDPGVAGPEPTGPEDFDLVAQAAQHRAGLVFLVDHPRLALALAGRVPSRDLLVAISPASIARDTSRAAFERPRARNVDRERAGRGGAAPGDERPPGGPTGTAGPNGPGDERDPRGETTPAPARRSEWRAASRAHAGNPPTPHPPAGDRPAPRPVAPALPKAARPPADDPGAIAADDAPLEPPKVPPPSPVAPAGELVEAARALGLATLAVPDVYHALPEGAEDHRVRVAIKHNALLCDLPAAWLAPGPAHLPTPEEMRALYADLPDVAGPHPVAPDGEVPAMVARTVLVAERCTYTPPLGEPLFPEVELGEDETAYARLFRLAFDGALARYRPLRPEVVRRLDYELESIDRLGFAAYFLLVDKIARFAREREIPCVGRGSAADSLVAYCLGLTDADPMRYRLPFERFLNPARTDRPDIDLDFCWRRRDEVLDHVWEAFGAERTAMITTLARFGLRSAFREAALVLGLPPAEVNRWSRRLPWAPPAPGGPVHPGGTIGGSGDDGADANVIVRALRGTPECRDFPFGDERWRRALRAAERLLDAPRHYGLHPGGVVVAPGPITDLVPCQRAAKGPIVTQLDKDAVEAVGLVKMDLLGNRALTVLDDTRRELARRGVEVELDAIPEDDLATEATLAEGRTLGCFQVESPGMRHLLQQIGARSMDDVIQAVALIRPGPAGSGMKDSFVRRFRGKEEPHPPHPRLADVLWETHGVMLYQEDVMQVAARIAGLDLAEADLLRRSLQKRMHPRLRELRERFLDGAEENGVERADAGRVWELVHNFASFAFCKAHAVTYGRIAYRAVYLKTHYPAVYMTAFLASETGYYAARVYVEEARRLGVPILPPDVNRSGETFAVEWVEPGRGGEPADGDALPCLRVGLSQVSGLTGGTRRAILEGRERHGPFLSLSDFLERTRARTDEATRLVQSGAFDSFDRTRPEMLWRLHLLRTPRTRQPRGLRDGGELGGPLDPAGLAACDATPEGRALDSMHRARASSNGWRGGLGVTKAGLAPGETASLFPPPETPGVVLPGLPDLDPGTRGRLELELLGLTLRAHPTRLFPCDADARIAALPARERPTTSVPCSSVPKRVGGRVTVRGWLAASRRVRTSNGEWMRFLTLEDESGLVEVVLFPDVYRRDGHHLNGGATVCVTGVSEDQMGAVTLHAERVW